MSKFQRCGKCKFKIEDGTCRNCGAIVARREVMQDPIRLSDYEVLEDTEVLPDPYDCVWERVERVERPTTPLPYSPIPLDSLESLIMRRQR